MARAQGVEHVGGTALDQQLRAAVLAYDAGRLEEARKWFEAVHAQQPTARTLRGLGVIAFRQGRFLEAALLLEASLDSREKPLTPELAQGVEVVLGDVRKQLGRVELDGLSQEARVLVDGTDAQRDASGALLVNPGAHTLLIARPGYGERRHELAIQAGGELRLDATLTPLVAAPEIAAPAVPQVQPRPELTHPMEPARSSRARRRRSASYGLLGFGAGALLTSLAATAAGIKRVGEIEAHCRAQDGAQCSLDEAQRLERKENLPLLSGLSIGGAVAGGVSVAAGGVLWLTLSRADRTPGNSASLLIRLGGAF